MLYYLSFNLESLTIFIDTNQPLSSHTVNNTYMFPRYSCSFSRRVLADVLCWCLFPCMEFTYWCAEVCQHCCKPRLVCFVFLFWQCWCFWINVLLWLISGAINNSDTNLCVHRPW